jgi:D-alanyl-D-alanine carboxypeptidase
MNFTTIAPHSLHECVNREVQANQEDFKLIGMHQLLVYVNDDNILGGSTNTIEKSTDILVVASKENGIDIKTVYMVLSKDQHVG